MTEFLFFLAITAVAFVAGCWWYSRWGWNHSWFGFAHEVEPIGLHEHVCQNCGYVWQHDDREISMFGIEAAHRCISCGDMRYEVDRMLEPA